MTTLLSGKRVLVCIPNFGTGQLHLTMRQLQALDDSGVCADVIFHTTHPLHVTHKNLRLQNVLVPAELGPRIAWLHRRVMAERINDYDLFIYAENDMLIEAGHLDTFLELDSILPEGTIAGLLRYELANGDTKTRYLPDAHGDWEVLESLERHGGELFFTIHNKHSACFVFTRAHLRLALQSGIFLAEPRAQRPYALLASAATSVYSVGHSLMGLRKVLSVSRLDSLLVHHLSDRYANQTKGCWARKPHTVESLKQLVSERLRSNRASSCPFCPTP